MEKTKEFACFSGEPMHLTREQYQRKWVDIIKAKFMVFSDVDTDDYWITMQKSVEEASGISWDKR